MSFIDEAKNKAQEVVGDAKEKVGERTDNDELRAEGQRDQTEGKVKGVGEDIKDKLK